MKKKKLTKKMATELFKKVIGISSGIKFTGDDQLDQWTVYSGSLQATCSWEVEYGLAGVPFQGDRLEMSLTIGEMFYRYFYYNSETLEEDTEYEEKYMKIFMQ